MFMNLVAFWQSFHSFSVIHFFFGETCVVHVFTALNKETYGYDA